MNGRIVPTNFINHGVAIREPSSWATREIDAIWVVVCPSKRWEIVVVSIVYKGVAEYKHCWYQLPPTTSSSYSILLS